MRLNGNLSHVSNTIGFKNVCHRRHWKIAHRQHAQIVDKNLSRNNQLFAKFTSPPSINKPKITRTWPNFHERRKLPKFSEISRPHSHSLAATRLGEIPRTLAGEERQLSFSRFLLARSLLRTATQSEIATKTNMAREENMASRRRQKKENPGNQLFPCCCLHFGAQN